MKPLSHNFLLGTFFLISLVANAQQLHVVNPASATAAAVLVENPANTIGVLIENTDGSTSLPTLKATSVGTGVGIHGENLAAAASILGLKQGSATGTSGSFSNLNAANSTSTLLGTTTGTGHAGDFIITNPANAVSAVYGKTNGTGAGAEGENTAAGASVSGIKQAAATGHAGLFTNTNAANGMAALSASTNSGAPAIRGINNAAGPSIEGAKLLGTGPAGIFMNTIGANAAPALLALSIGGPAIEAVNGGTAPSLTASKTTGTGHSGLFENVNAGNMLPTLAVSNVNTALPALAVNVIGNTSLMGNTFTKNLDIMNNVAARPAAVVNNSMTAHPGLHINQDHMANPAGSAPGLLVDQKSDGEGASINIINGVNAADALTAATNGTGSAGSFSATKPTNGSSALIGIHSGTGAGVEGANTSSGHSVLGTKGAAATGHAGFFITSDPANAFPTLKLIHANVSAGFHTLDVDGNAIISGDVDVDDLVATTITAGSKFFRIDHPLDPQNKYLRHCSIESSEMINIYTGNVVLGKNGKATVALPEWFEALNKDFRYHLTCVGGFAKVYVSKEVRNGQFQIAGGKKGMKISWQVSGVRHDRFAVENPLQVEEEKK